MDPTQPSDASKAPTTNTSDTLFAVWTSYVDTTTLGFFDAGGNSVDAVLMMNDCEATFGVAFPVELLLANAPATAVAAEIERRVTNVSSQNR